ncbi:MAG: toll/interleukin-1 receptor domain-containing protein, partial [Nitrospirales bacterium]
MADIFISYKRAERPRVQLITDLLRADGFDVWFDTRLELGRGEGFDAEIEREVTSAACVLVCWTPEATKSVYVKAEAKKGIDREVLVPMFLEECVLPVPFNAIDAADLTGWSGNVTDERWIALQTKIKETVNRSKADE